MSEARAREWFPLSPEDSDWCSIPYVGYGEILAHFGNPVIDVTDDDYQGDTRVLFDEGNNRVGYLQFGWGSCSGCDALQACDTYVDLGELIESLESRILWDTPAGMLAYFQSHDWEGDYSWHEEGQKQFIAEVIEYLSKRG